MKRIVVSLIVAVCIAATPSMVQADLASVAAAIGAPIDPGLAPTGLFGRVIGGNEDSGYQLTPFETLISGYDYAMPSPLGSAAGDLRDFHWIHEFSGAFAPPAAGTMWSFGNAYGNAFILDPSLDHPPIPEEAFETTLWGSNDGGTTWILGTLDRIYAPGWHAGSIEDEPSSRFVFAQSVNMISATAGFAQGTFSFDSADTEIDAVSMVGVVPLPGAVVLGAIGLGMVGWIKRRTR